MVEAASSVPGRGGPAETVRNTESQLPSCERAGNGLRLRRVRGYDRRAGRFPACMSEQFRLAVSAGDAALCARGASMEDVVRVIYLVKDASQFGTCVPFVTNIFGASRPAATVLVVDGFDRPDVEIELELITRRPGTPATT